MSGKEPTPAPDELRIDVGGPSAITGRAFDPERDAGFLELCVRNDYGRDLRFDRYDPDTRQAVFRRADEPEPQTAERPAAS